MRRRGAASGKAFVLYHLVRSPPPASLQRMVYHSEGAVKQSSNSAESIQQKTQLINSQQVQVKNHKKPSYQAKLYEFSKGRVIIPVLVFTGGVALIGLAAALAVIMLQPCLGPPDSTAAWCPKGWLGFDGHCYYFSEDEGSWDVSQSSCSSLSASLAVIESEEEKDFMLRYKGKPDHWVGLRREQEQGQPWKWPSGSEFNNWFAIRGGGECAYLSENGVSSSQCYMERRWICRKPDGFTKRKELAVEGH